MTPLRHVVADYLDQLAAEGLSPKSIDVYRRFLDLLLDHLSAAGCRTPADVTAADLDAFHAALHAAGRAHGTRVGIACLVRRCFAWLTAHGHCPRNPAGRQPVAEDTEPPLPPPPLDDATVRTLIDALPCATVFDLRGRCLLEVLYGCALRIGEACGLDLADVDTAQRVVVVRNGKHGQSRMVPLMDGALAAVRDYLAVRRTLLKGPDHGAFFLNQYGRRLTVGAARDWLDDLNTTLGPEAVRLRGFHQLRHALAVSLLRRGADIRIVQAALGHARLDTTKVYLRLVPGQIAEVYHRAMPDLAVEMADPSPAPAPEPAPPGEPSGGSPRSSPC